MVDQDLGTTIKFTVDATGVEAGTTRVKRSLKDVGKTASEVGKQTGDAIGGGGDEAAKKMEAATRRISNEFKRLQIDAASMGKSLSEKIVIKADAYGIPRAAIEEQRAALKAFEDAQRAANPAMVQFQKLADASGTSVKGLGAALKQVPAQFTDIVVSLQGGQNPLTVLLQQGGQLKDTFGGIAPAARALGGHVVGLINPFTLAAAAVGTLGYSYFQGSKEQDEYRKSLVLTGNAIGLTTGQMADMARSMAAVGGTQSKAAEALVAFVNAGAAGSDSLQKFTQSAINFEKVTGQAVEETAKQFAELGKNPLEASIKLNESTNFLTMSLYEQIKALEERGKKTEAANVAQQAYSDTLNQNTAQITANLGTIEKSWNAITSATKSAWDWMKNIGRDTGPQQKLAQLQIDVINAENNLKSAIASSFGGAFSGKAKVYEKELQAAQDKLAEFNKTSALSQIRASDRGIEAQQLKDKIEWDKSHQNQLDKLQAQLRKEIEDYKGVQSRGEDSAENRLKYEQAIHHLVKQEADYLKSEYKTELKTTKPKAESFDPFGKELTATKQWLATKERMLQDSYNAQKQTIEDVYKAQEISAAQYYARQITNDEDSLREREKVRAEAQARFDVEMAKRVAETQARPASEARTTALKDLRSEAENFAEAQKTARQKDRNALAAQGAAMALEIDKQAQKVTESVDTYVADMKRKEQADAALLAAREAMAGQAPEIIAGMEAELKVRADAAKILDQTAEAYSNAAKEARVFEDSLQSKFDGGTEATNAEILVLETLKSTATQARKKLLELGGAVDTTALDASITSTAASIKKQTDEVAKEIQKTLVDGIMSAGKDGGAGLRKALEDVLITKPFRIVVEALIQPVSNAIAQGVMGQSLGAGAAGAGGISTALNAASLAVSTFGTNAMEAAKAITLEGASFGEVVSTISSEFAAGKFAAGIGGAVGAAAPFAIAAVAAHALYGAMQGSVTPTGTFLYGGQGKFGGRQDFAQSGGLFGGGNTKNSSWFDPAPEVTKYMAAVSDAITSSVKDTAKAIGLNTDAISGYNKQIEVSIGGLDGPQMKAAIDKAFTGMADDMVESLFGGMLLPLSKSGETASQTMTRLVSDLQAVNGVLTDLNKPLMDMSLSGADATEALLKSVGGLDKFKTLATGLTTVNQRLEQLGLPLLDVSVAGAQAAESLLKATENALKAKEAADKLQSETDSFSMALLTANGQSTTSVLQAIADRTMASVKASMPAIGDWASLSRITPEQYAGYSDVDRAKLNAAVAAHNTLRSAMDESSKAAESAAKSAKDAADTAAKAYSDALQSVQDDTQSVLAQTADIGKTEFQKQIAQIQRDGVKKQAELDKLSTASDKAAKEYADLTKAATDSAKAVTTLATVFDDASAGAKALGGTASKMIADIATALAKAGVKTPEAQRAEALAMTVVQPGKGFATGGAIAGPGTGTSDSIPAMLSDGEYVIKASSAAKLGTRFLDAINAGGMPATVFRADGGSVGFDPNSKKSIIDTWVGALNWSAETMLSSAMTLQAVAEDNNITVSQLKEFGYSLDTFSSDTKALIQANISPKTWDWVNGAMSEPGGQPYTPTSTVGTVATTGATGGSSAVTESVVANLTGAYSTQLNDLSKLYGTADTFATAVTKLKNGATTASGDTGVGKYTGDVSATGIKDYIQGLLATASGPKNLDGTFTTKATNAIDVLDAMGASIATVTKTLEERQGLQDQLDELTMNSTQLLEKQRAALAETNRALFDQIHAATKANQVAEERKGLQDQLDELALSGVQLLEKQRAALDASNQALFDQIQAQTTAAEVAKEAAEVAKANASLQDKIALAKNPSLQREIEKRNELASVTDASTKALIAQYYAQLDANDAIAKAAELAKTNAGWQDKIAIAKDGTQQREIEKRNELESATDASTKTLIAQYYAQLDANDAAQAAQEAANALAQAYAGLKDQIAQARIELLKASGNTQAAEEATMALALRDHAGDEYYASLYRELLTIQKLTEARNQLNTLEESAVQKQIALNRANWNSVQGNVLSNRLERSAALQSLTAPAASAKAELDRSGENFTQFLTRKGLTATNNWDVGIENMLNSMSSIFGGDARQTANWVAGQQTVPDNKNLLLEFAQTRRTTEQKSTLQGVVDSAASIAAAYDKNKALEAELKIIELQDEAYKQNLDAQKSLADAQKAYADVLKSTISTMQDFLKTLDGAASPLQNLSTSRANFQAIAGRAASGDTSAYKDLTPAAKTFLDLSKNYSKSIVDYQRDEARVRATLNAVINVNQNELDKLPQEIAKASDPTKDAWIKLQEATAKEADTSVMLTALGVDSAESKRRLRAAEETLGDRYIEAVYLLDETKKTSLLDAFNTAVNTKVSDVTLPTFDMTFDLGNIWSTEIAKVLPYKMTNEDWNKLIAEKFPGLVPSDFVGKLTTDGLTDLIRGVMPAQLTVDSLISTTADVSDIVNTKIGEILPANFAGASFDAQQMMQDAINRAMAVTTPARPVVPDLSTNFHNTVQDQGLGGGSSGVGTSSVEWGSLTLEEKAKAAGVSSSSLYNIDYLKDIVATYQREGVTDSPAFLRLKDYLHYRQVPGFAVGTNNVPHDMYARIHKDEVVIPAAFNPERYAKASGNTALVEKIQVLTDEVVRLTQKLEAGQNAIAANTRKTAQVLAKFDTDGMPATQT